MNVKDLAPQPIHLGVVTVTYNAKSLLNDFFESLERQGFRDFTVYLVDNASPDGTAELVRNSYSSQCVLIANDNNLGVAEGNNQGVRKARASGCTHILLINNDTVFDSGLFAKLLECANTSKHKIVVPKIPFESHRDRIWFGGGDFGRWQGFSGRHRAYGEIDVAQCDVPQDITYSPTCCMLVEGTVFDLIGVMDPTYFVYFDDVDFCYRIYSKGLKIRYLPSAVIFHKVGGSTEGDASPFSIRHMVRNRVYFVRKHFGAKRQVVFLIYMFLLQIYKGLFFGNFWLRMKAYCEGVDMDILRGRKAQLK